MSLFRYLSLSSCSRPSLFLPSMRVGGSKVMIHGNRRGFVSADGLDSNHPVWKLGKLNHIALAVPDLEKSTKFWRDVMGAVSVSEPLAQPAHGVYTVFVDLGNTKVELLGKYGDRTPIDNFLHKNKSGGIHHVCIEVDDIKTAMKSLVAKDIRSLDPEPKIGAHGNPVVFLHPKDCGGVLVELEEVK